jgi:uncharacterized protein YdcH (DUF465 family)
MKKQNLTHAVLKQPIKAQEITISHPHFRKFDEYHALDQKILRIITGIETANQDELKKMKLQLLYLKSELYAIVRA